MVHIVTITVDGCEIRQVEVELAREGWDQRLVDGLQDIRREVVAAILEGEDALLVGQVPEGWENLGREGRQVLTLAGKVDIVRRVYRDREGQRHKPLDEELGLSRYEHSTWALKRMVGYLASGASYRRAAELASWAIGERITCMRVLRAAWEVGQALERQEEAERGGVFECGEAPKEGQTEAEIVYAEADGVWLSLQREARRGAEARVAIFYTGKELLGAGRHCLQNKVTVTRLGCSSQEWQETLLLEVYRHFALSKTKVLVLNGDGAGWVRHSLDRVEWPVIYQLDPFHLYQAARAAAPQTVPLVRRARQQGLDAIKDELQDLIRGADAGTRERLLDFERYLHSNADGLIDYRIRLGLDSARSMGLGAIEGNVDKLVVQRMKGRGMSWRMRGATAMLALCRHRDDLQTPTLPLGGYGYRTTPKHIARPAQPHRSQQQETWLQASVPLLHSTAENTPLGRTLRHIVNGPPGLSL
jgi:hypothetical protein